MEFDQKKARASKKLRPITESILEAIVSLGRKLVPQQKTPTAPQTPAAPDSSTRTRALHVIEKAPIKHGLVESKTELPKAVGATPQDNVLLARERTRQLVAEAGTKEEAGDEVPDVFLEIPTVKVDEIKLNVEELDAKVALHAELDNLVRIDVGAQVGIAKVELDIKGVEAQALLKVRLKQVYAILARALETVDRNPELVHKLLQPVGEAVGALGKEGARAVGEIGQQTGKALGPGGALGETIHDITGVAGKALAPEGTVGRAVTDVGEVAKGVTAQQGPVSEAIRGVSDGVDQAVKGKTDETEQERRYYSEEGRHHERTPESPEKKSA